jgi:hypothetical protein
MRIGDDGSVGFYNDTRTMTLTSGADVNGGSSEPLGDFAESWKHVYRAFCGRSPTTMLFSMSAPARMNLALTALPITPEAQND